MLSVQVEMSKMETLLQASANRHHNLCPRQVLGVRMGMYAADLFQISLPRYDRALFTFVESDGCFLDGVAASTGCSVGSRSMMVMDFGKIAATFVQPDGGEALRIYPHPDARSASRKYMDQTTGRWKAYLIGYQRMALDELFAIQRVELSLSMEKILSRSDARAVCDVCGEEIFNEREAISESGAVLCRSCAGNFYYRMIGNGVTS